MRALLAIFALAVPPEEAVIRYHVSFPERRAHRVAVRMSVDGARGETVDLGMPVWTPGSYLVREFARHVVELTARDAEGAPLPATKVDKNTWRVATGGAAAFEVDYELYANERSVRTNHVDADHAFLSPAATFLFVDGRLGEPHHVTVDAPDGWGVFTGLPEEGEGHTARDYDHLVDSPFEIGPHRVETFELRGVPHRLVMTDAPGVPFERIRDDARTICAEVAEIVDVMPFERYTFLLQFPDENGGGLEHADSSVCMFSRWELSKPDRYRRFLSLIAHEYFHAWNVKRFRPEALGPFDYEREVYTPDLWVAEGVTSYLDDLTVARAGFEAKPQDYLKRLAEAFEALHRTPGRRRMSIARASHDAWIKLYRPDENSRNVSVSYYSKGGLVALLLDLRLRRVTGGGKRLEDLLRLGWERYAARDVGFPPGALAELASEVAGEDLSGFFADHVTGTADLRPDDDLAWVGLRLVRKPKEIEDDDARAHLPLDEDGFRVEPVLGVEVEGGDERCRIKAVREDAPAFAAGLNVGDELLAVDGLRVTAETLRDRLDRRGFGPVELTLFRGQELRTLTLTPALERLETWAIEPVEAPTDAQRAAFAAWLGLDWPFDADGG